MQGSIEIRLCKGKHGILPASQVSLVPGMKTRYQAIAYGKREWLNRQRRCLLDITGIFFLPENKPRMVHSGRNKW